VAEALAKKLPAELDLVTLRKAYARWAPVYDLVFGALFDRGRRAAIAAAEQVGGRILEVGVGTGISLPGYSSHNRIVGIDLSEPMLRKAQRRVANLSLTNVEILEVMDAEHLSFPDASFDVVVAKSRDFDRAKSADSARRVRPNAQAWRRDDPPQSDRCRCRLATSDRIPVATDRSPAGMADRVSLEPIRSLDRTANRCAPDRAPADAAIWSFLAPQVCEVCKRVGSMITADRGLRRAVLEPCIIVENRC